MDKILVNIDLKSDPGVLLEKVKQLALANNSFVELFNCCYNRSIVQGYMFDKTEEQHAEHGFMKQIEAKLEKLCRPLQEAGLRVGFDVCWNRHTGEGIVRKVLRFQPDILIHGVQPHSRLGHYLFAPVDWQLARKCPVPVLFVKNRPWKAHTRLLACVDPLHEGDQAAALDRQIISTGMSLTPDYFTELRLLHCFNTLPHEAIFDEHMVTDYEALQVEVEKRHKDACEDLLRDFRLSGGDLEIEVQHGEAEQVITEYAAENEIDVVALGAVARSVLDRLLVGSTIEYLVDNIEADVLVLKHPDFECPVAE